MDLAIRCISSVTSASGRAQFSSENAKRLSHLTPASTAYSQQALTLSVPS